VTVAETRPDPPRRRLPRAASPDQFDQMTEDLVAEVTKAKVEYRWLYGSGYARGRKGNGEKVRRDISGAGGDLADGFDSLDRLRNYLDQASDHQRKSLIHALGAGSALGRCQDRIDAASKPTLVALDPLEPASADKPFTPEYLRGMTPTEAKARQKDRAERVAGRGEPWASEEITG
jgi:hypothetical protein